jgi:hypothetical protein
MDTRKHIYYLTVGDVQTVAQETIGHSFGKKIYKKLSISLQIKSSGMMRLKK